MKNKFKFLATMLIGVLLSTNVWGDGVATLPVNYTFAGNSYPTGCSGNGLGLQGYKDSHAPYRLKFDDTGDYLQIQTDAAAEQIIFGVKKIGGKNNSTFTVQGSSNGSSYTDIESFSISGAQDAVVNCTTTVAINSDYRYFKFYFTKSSNVGFGTLVISKASAPATHYTVSFYNNDDYVGEFTTATYNGKEYLDELPDMSSASFPHPTSTTFAGWTTDEINGETQTTITADNLVDTYTVITEDISVNALWGKVDNDNKVTFTASELSQSPVGGYYDWTIDGINFYYKQSEGTIYGSSPKYFEVSAGNRFTVDAGNRIINKIDFTVYSSTFCIGSMTDGSLSEVSNNKQTATNINAYYTQGIAPDDNEADFSQMVVTCYTDYITHYTACTNEVNVNKGSMTGGDITISAETVCADDGGGSVTVTPNPNAHYSCTNVTATVGSVTGPVAGVYTVSGITAATTISATFVEDAKYTVTWKVKGVTVKSTQVYVGETDAAPAVADEDIPTDCADAFVGWSTSTLTGTGHSAPPDLFNTTSPVVSDDVTYHAVFATTTGGGTVTHTMDVPQDVAISGYEERNFTDDQGYTWSGKFSGFDNYGEKFWSLSKNSDNYHISSPTFAGNVSSIKFWVRQTAEGTRTIILRSNTSTAQPSVSDMGLTADVSQNANVQEVTITPTTQEFTQFNIYVSNGFGFRKIQVVTGGGVTYSNYVTSCAVYTVTFKSNGADVTTVPNVAPGQQVTAPTLAYIRSKVDAKNVCTNYLVGWSTDSHYTDPSDAPIGMLKPNAEGKITIPSDITSDVTYYAVYADVVQQ